MFSHPEELDESLVQAERHGQEDTDNLADVDELLHVGIDGAAKDHPGDGLGHGRAGAHCDTDLGLPRASHSSLQLTGLL